MPSTKGCGISSKVDIRDFDFKIKDQDDNDALSWASLWREIKSLSPKEKDSLMTTNIHQQYHPLPSSSSLHALTFHEQHRLLLTFLCTRFCKQHQLFTNLSTVPCTANSELEGAPSLSAALVSPLVHWSHPETPFLLTF